MTVFQSSTRVPAAPEELFRFHENPHNLRLISPPGLKILGIEAEESARPGENFTVAVRPWPLTLRWTGRWEKVEPPRLLVDTGVSCPFRHWRHSHVFEPHPEGGSLLTDRIEFALPWSRGGPLGDLLARHVVFPAMFAARHAATRSYFSRQ